MNPALLGLIATTITVLFTGGGVLFWRSTNAQLKANAQLSLAQASKTNEEREGVAATNADKLIALMEGVMDKQNARFEAEVGRMKIQAEQMGLAALRQEQTIESLRALLIEERQGHEAAMEAERHRCDRALEELHLRIDALSKKVQYNTESISHIDAGGASMLDIPVIITPVHQEEPHT